MGVPQLVDSITHRLADRPCGAALVQNKGVLTDIGRRF